MAQIWGRQPVKRNQKILLIHWCVWCVGRQYYYPQINGQKMCNVCSNVTRGSDVTAKTTGNVSQFLFFFLFQSEEKHINVNWNWVEKSRITPSMEMKAESVKKRLKGWKVNAHEQHWLTAEVSLSAIQPMTHTHLHYLSIDDSKASSQYHISKKCFFKNKQNMLQFINQSNDQWH